MFKMVTGWMTKLMDLEFTSIKMDQNMKENGLKINNTGKERKFGRMVLNLKVTTRLGRKKVKENFNGQMDRCTKANSKVIVFMALDSIDGQMAEHITDNGKKM